MLIQLKWILDKLFSIWSGWYQPMQLYLKAGFSLPTQASLFLICAGDSVGSGYRPGIMPRADIYLNL